MGSESLDPGWERHRILALFSSLYRTRRRSSRERTAYRVVMDLCSHMFGSNLTVYMDNYYTSPELLRDLHLRGIMACGTVRSNHKRLTQGFTASQSSSEQAWIQSCTERPAYVLCVAGHEAGLCSFQLPWSSACWICDKENRCWQKSSTSSTPSCRLSAEHERRRPLWPDDRLLSAASSV